MPSDMTAVRNRSMLDYEFCKFVPVPASPLEVRQKFAMLRNYVVQSVTHMNGQGTEQNERKVPKQMPAFRSRLSEYRGQLDAIMP